MNTPSPTALQPVPADPAAAPPLRPKFPPMTHEHALRLFSEIALIASCAHDVLDTAVGDGELRLAEAAAHLVQKIGFIADAACQHGGDPGCVGDAFDWMLSPHALQAFGRGEQE